jgi:hypothetical protein
MSQLGPEAGLAMQPLKLIEELGNNEPSPLTFIMAWTCAGSSSKFGLMAFTATCIPSVNERGNATHRRLT